ncbi:MAG: SRPBCC domain-containing protein [Chitinophagales bacterium]|nr:SRPBCC domain-containing protein [Chitinophagales bacterium]
MENNDFSYRFETGQTAEAIFPKLLDARYWWSGIHAEVHKGASQELGDEFTFEAGDGAHYSKQKLVELIPNEKITWSVIDSKLTFLDDTSEWTGTQFGFELSNSKGNTIIIFTHYGLLPQVECYNTCSNAWIQYLTKLEQHLS